MQNNMIYGLRWQENDNIRTFLGTCGTRYYGIGRNSGEGEVVKCSK